MSPTLKSWITRSNSLSESTRSCGRISEVKTPKPIDEHRTLMEGYVVASRTPPEGIPYEKWDAGVASCLGYMDRIVEEDRQIAGEIGAVRNSFGYQGNLYNRLECRLSAFHRELEARLA